MKPSSTLAAAVCVTALTLGLSMTRGVAQSGPQAVGESPLPLWAYPVAPPASRPAVGSAPSAAGDIPQHVPGSKASYTRKEIPDLFLVPDWFPDEHPAMPPVVATGRKPDVAGCGHCHQANGLGRPENASIAGLPEVYILQQLEDFKSGARKSSEPGMASVGWMIRLSKHATPEEMKESAAYFAGLKLTRWIRVVETDTVPLTRVDNLMMVVADPNTTEPIGTRVIEVSEDYAQTELRNPHSGFVAYVPKGSLKRGEHLAKTGGEGTTIACTICHGVDLKGVGNVPSIAGRSPSQMGRQLIDFQRGNRNGPSAALMKAPVAKLTTADIVALTGYLASLEP